MKKRRVSRISRLIPHMDGNAVIPDLYNYNRGRNLPPLGFFRGGERQVIMTPPQDS